MSTEVHPLLTQKLEVALCDQAVLRCERTIDRWAAWLADDHVQRFVLATAIDKEMIDILKLRMELLKKTKDSLNEELEKVLGGEYESVAAFACLTRDFQYQHAGLLKNVSYLERRLVAYESTKLKLKLAFAMCMHPRLGGKRGLGELPEDVLKSIARKWHARA